MQALPPRPAPRFCHHLVTLTFAALLGWFLLAAITPPVSSGPAANTNARQGLVEHSVASGPFHQWLVEEGGSRSALRTKSWPATGGNDEEEDGASPLAHVLFSSVTQSSTNLELSGLAAPPRLANPRTSPSSPRAPPVAAQAA